MYVRIVGLCATLSMLLLPLVNCQQRAKYGEPCGSSIRCESRSSLGCIENTCQCLKPDEMVYNEDLEKCVVLLGERCSYTATEIQTESVQWTEKFDCVQNASCSGSGFCECDHNYFDDTKGTCEPKKLHGESCSSDSHCRKDALLTCIGGKCSCDKSDTMVFDTRTELCRGKVGTSCRSSSDCVSLASCDGYHSNNRNCSCDYNTTPSKDGRCLSKHGNKCAFSSDCWGELVCISGTCKCPYQSHQQYIPSKEKCITFVRGPCNEHTHVYDLQETECTKNARCMNVSGVYECACSKGYIELDRKCVKKSGQPCTSSDECDQFPVLICQDKKCCCPGLHVYNENTHTCDGLVGAVCGNDPAARNKCVKGAFCDQFRSFQKGFSGIGVCKCLGTHKVTSQRMCVPVSEESQSSDNTAVRDDSSTTLFVNGNEE